MTQQYTARVYLPRLLWVVSGHCPGSFEPERPQVLLLRMPEIALGESEDGAEREQPSRGREPDLQRA